MEVLAEGAIFGTEMLPVDTNTERFEAFQHPESGKCDVSDL